MQMPHPRRRTKPPRQQRSRPTKRPTTRRCAICRTSNTILGTASVRREDDGGALRPRGAAGRFVGPISIESGDAEFDAPIRANKAGVLGDRVIDWMLRAVADHRGAATETAWNGLCRPGKYRGLTDVLDADDL